MAQEGNNDSNEYYVPMRTILGRRIVKPKRFGQAAAISLGILNCQCNDFLQTPQPGSIETIKNELENVSTFKATIKHMDLISRNYDKGFINLVDPIILETETSHKDNINLGEAMKVDDCDDFMKAMEKEINFLTTEDVWEILPQ